MRVRPSGAGWSAPMKSTGRHLQRNIRPAGAGPDGPMRRLGVDLHNQIGFKGHKYDVRSSSFESSGKVLPWTGWACLKNTYAYYNIASVVSYDGWTFLTCRSYFSPLFIFFLLANSIQRASDEKAPRTFNYSADWF